MPTTYTECPKEVKELAQGIIDKVKEHELLKACKAKIDFLFAHPPVDKHGNPTGVAMKHHGRRVLGKTRIINLKDRSKGHGDAEIILDAEWWNEVDERQRQAVLDHELCHIDFVVDKDGHLKRDDLDRPKLKLRHHDFELNWFKEIAQRYGTASQECQQAIYAMEEAGQYFWPALAGVTPRKLTEER